MSSGSGIDRRRFMQLAGLSATTPRRPAWSASTPCHVFAMATAIALATVAVAGLFLGVRTTFTPASGRPG